MNLKQMERGTSPSKIGLIRSDSAGFLKPHARVFSRVAAYPPLSVAPLSRVRSRNRSRGEIMVEPVIVTKAARPVPAAICPERRFHNVSPRDLHDRKISHAGGAFVQTPHQIGPIHSYSVGSTFVAFVPLCEPLRFPHKGFPRSEALASLRTWERGFRGRCW
jgi:hypothetical protein